MKFLDHARAVGRYTGLGAALLSTLANLVAPPTMAAQSTTSPIKHVIVIIGENRTFDHIFATYQPKRGETVDNLLSKRIINSDGTPGPFYFLAHQRSACDLGKGASCPNTGETDVNGDKYELSPKGKALYNVLPAPLTGGPSDVCKDNGICTLAQAQASENGLAPGYYQFLTSGGTGLPGKTPDTRIANVNNLPPGPFQLTTGSFTYDDYAASPVHRFYQMWQQQDCDVRRANPWNPGGCLNDLFPWVETTVGAGTNGVTQPANFSTEYSTAAVTTGEGSTAMGFYNMLQGDAPYLKFLADHYAMSDNYHQAVNGGTGANHIMMGFGDDIWFSDGNGNPAVPPENQVVYAGTPSAGTVNEIEDPEPAAGTNNWYSEDGYGGGAFGSPSFGGGSYTNCADLSQPGVAAIRSYLSSLPRKISANCEKGHYYILNNYNPGYFGDGSNAYTDNNVANTPFTIPPTSVRNIGDALLEKNVSWKYYGDQWNQYLTERDGRGVLDRGGRRRPYLAADAEHRLAQRPAKRPIGHPGHADPPAAERQVLAQRRGDHGAVRCDRRRAEHRGGGVVDEVAVDLVGDDDQAVLVGDPAQGPDRVRPGQPAGRVVGHPEQQRARQTDQAKRPGGEHEQDTADDADGCIGEQFVAKRRGGRDLGHDRGSSQREIDSTSNELFQRMTRKAPLPHCGRGRDPRSGPAYDMAYNFGKRHWERQIFFAPNVENGRCRSTYL